MEQRCSRRGTDKLGLQHPRYNRACLHPVFYRVIPQCYISPRRCYADLLLAKTVGPFGRRVTFNRRPFNGSSDRTIELPSRLLLVLFGLVKDLIDRWFFPTKLFLSSTNSNYSQIDFPSFNRVVRFPSNYSTQGHQLMMERDRAKVKPSDEMDRRRFVSWERETRDSCNFYRFFYRIKKLRYHKWILRMARVLHTIPATGISFLFSARWQADLIKIWMGWKYYCRVGTASGTGLPSPADFPSFEKRKGGEREKGTKGAATIRKGLLQFSCV